MRIATTCSPPFVFADQSKLEEANELQVLVVEDTPVNCQLTERLLKKRAYSLTLANNLAEAVDRCEKNHCDPVMDMQMPVRGGIEATESIRSLDRCRR